MTQSTDQSMRILLVEDDADTARSTMRLLKQDGHAVSLASTCSEALAKIRSDRPDLILMDRNLPDGDGLQLCRQCKADAALRDIFVVMISSSLTSKSDQVRGLESGADGYISRPIGNHELQARVGAFVRIVQLNAQMREKNETLQKTIDAYESSRAETARLLEAAELSRRALLSVAEDQEQVAAQLRESEERLRAYVEQAADCMFIHDDVGQFLDVNPQACVSLGYSREELLEMNLFDVETMIDFPRAQKAWSNLLPGHPFILEGMQRRRDGSTFPVETRLGCFNLEGRRCYFAMVRDISERKSAEEALRDSEANMTEAQRIGHFGNWELDLTEREHPDVHALRWSDEVYRIVGIEPSTFGASYEAFLATVHPADRDLLEAAHKQVVSGEGNLNLEHRILRPDGTVRWVRELAELKSDDVGRATRLAGTTLDITERKLAELRLHRLNRLHTVLGKVGEAIVRTRDRQQLYESVCRIMVEDELLRMVSIMDAEGSSVRPAACAGAGSGYLEGITVSTDGGLLNQGTIGTAIHTGQPAFSNDLANDERMRPWSERLLRYGFYSCASFPLMIGEATVGALVLFADETEYFETDEMHLMTAVANALSSALEALQKEEQRRVAMIALRASEASLADAQRRVKMGNWDFDFAMKTGRWSAEMFRLYDRDPALGVPSLAEFETLPHPDDRELVARVVAEAIAAGLPFQQDFRVLRPDGNIRWVARRAEMILDTDGKAVRMVGTSQDITERKLAEEALQRSEASLSAAQTVAKIGSWETDLTTMGVFWSAETYRIFGVKEPHFEPTHEKFIAMVHPEDREAVEMALNASRENSAPCRFTHRLVLPDGVNKWVEERWVVTRDKHGKALRAIGTCQDITERHESEEQLAEQAALIDQAHDAILVRDVAGYIVFWSKGAERLYGWTREETIGQCYEKLLRPDPPKLKVAQRCVDLEGEWSGELEMVTKTGTTLTLDSRWTLLPDEAGQPKSYLHFDSDITEWKKIQQQYLRAQRMESIGTLAGGIAHDLNNVLAPIMMAVELLEMQEKDAQKLSILKTIETSSKRGAEMVGQVLSFARGVEGQQVEVQISHLIREIETLVHEAFPKNLQISCDIPGNLWIVHGDPTQIHQVLLNLCVNARDAMPYGGALSISASNLILDEHYAAMTIEARPGPHLRIVVEDSGTGITPEIIERIFDPFFTTKELGKGTGLGLSTTSAIIKSHGGFIRIYSEVGVGTRFHIYLPALTGADASVPETVDIELPRGQGQLILVIDDEAAIRNITKQTLEAFGYRAVLASDGAEAAAIYGVRQQEIAAVLTDMMMPVMDGPAITQVLIRMNPRVRIIATSGLNANGVVARASNSGVKHFIPKPYTAETLLRVLHSTLQP